MEIETLEAGAFFSLVGNNKHAAGLFLGNANGGPTGSLSKDFAKGGGSNSSLWHDPVFDAKLQALSREPDEVMRQNQVKKLSREIIEQAPHIWLPTPYVYTAWWPWVKNYGGEIYAGGFRTDPIFARIWIDLELKKQMGY